MCRLSVVLIAAAIAAVSAQPTGTQFTSQPTMNEMETTCGKLLWNVDVQMEKMEVCNLQVTGWASNVNENDKCIKTAYNATGTLADTCSDWAKCMCISVKAMAMASNVTAEKGCAEGTLRLIVNNAAPAKTDFNCPMPNPSLAGYGADAVITVVSGAATTVLGLAPLLALLRLYNSA